MNAKITAGLLAGATLLLTPGCARNTSEAGVKPVGVGFDPGDLFLGPTEKGGLIDYVLVQFRGTNLDLGATGLYFSTGAFTDPEADPFDAVLGYAMLFSPAIVAADEYSLLSPKGPDVPGACLVQIDSRGPLGSFRTVDVGDRIIISNQDEDPTLRTEYTLPRDPQNYPTNTTSVYLSYGNALPLIQGQSGFPDNWVFDDDVYMHFGGGLPPENTPVASIPRPSDAADEVVGKEAGDPVVPAPADLGVVMVSNQESGADAVAMRYAPGMDLPDPTSNDHVVNVSWDVPENGSDALVVISLKLLGADEGEELEDGSLCVPAVSFTDAEKDADPDWLSAYSEGKARWCDPGYEPDETIGNNESGNDAGDNNCSDGVDNDGDGACDESGCLADDGVTWLNPDPSCARHSYATATCGNDGLCRDVGGDRNPDGHLGELICTAEDTGSFTLAREDIEELIETVGADNVRGAMLAVARESEVEITVPLVRNQVGNQDDINPVRFRASQVQFGRMTWER